MCVCVCVCVCDVAYSMHSSLTEVFLHSSCVAKTFKPKYIVVLSARVSINRNKNSDIYIIYIYIYARTLSGYCRECSASL